LVNNSPLLSEFIPNTWLPPVSPGAGCPAYASIRIKKKKCIKKEPRITAHITIKHTSFVSDKVHSKQKNYRSFGVHVPCFINNII